LPLIPLRHAAFGCAESQYPHGCYLVKWILRQGLCYALRRSLCCAQPLCAAQALSQQNALRAMAIDLASAECGRSAACFFGPKTLLCPCMG
jgi:hypothetical protein